jgi:hypothetical protein
MAGGFSRRTQLHGVSWLVNYPLLVIASLPFYTGRWLYTLQSKELYKHAECNI